MSERLTFDVLGTGFTIEADVASTASELKWLWGAFRSPAGGHVKLRMLSETASGSPPPRDGWIDLVARRGDHVAMAAAEINRTSLARFAGFAVHAGVVAHGPIVAALPAVSGAGKTTMVAACIAAGWSYVSDEALCIGYADHRVVPYPKPLALSEWSAGRVGLTAGIISAGERLATAADLGGRDALTPGRLTDVIALDRVEGARPSLSMLHRAEAVNTLLEMSFNHYLRPADAFVLVTRLAQNIRCWRLTYSDPMAAAAILTAHLTV